MRMPGAIAAILVLAVLVLVTWYKLTFPSYTFHYRLAVEVEVDGEVREASGVIGIYWEQLPAPLPDMNSSKLTAFGQAILLDLGEHGCILIPVNTNTRFAGTSTYAIPFRAFLADEPPAYRGPPHTPDGVRKTLRSSGRVQLAIDNLPQFIWLRNSSDPDTAQVVQIDEFPITIAPTVRFIGAWVEITSDPVSSGLEDKLPWLNDIYPPRTATYRRDAQDPRFHWVVYALWREKDDI